MSVLTAWQFGGLYMVSEEGDDGRVETVAFDTEGNLMGHIVATVSTSGAIASLDVGQGVPRGRKSRGESC